MEIQNIISLLIAARRILMSASSARQLQLVCTCSRYDLCHPGYIAYRQTHSQIDSQTDGRAAFDRLYY